MISEFRGKYYFLSNYFPYGQIVDGKIYSSNEHYFQACKAATEELHEYVRIADTPQDSKVRGRKVRIREDWLSIRDYIMLKGLRAKFSNPDLKELLLNTGDKELIEGNWWGDVYWGISNGKGENKLGKLLMHVREELK